MPKFVESRKDHDVGPGPFPVTVVRPAVSPPVAATPAQRIRRRDAAAWAATITWRAQDSTEPHLVRYRLRTASVRATAWTRDVIRDAAALAATTHPWTVQIGRARAVGIVAVVIHADTWSLVIRTHTRDGILQPGYAVAFTDADTTKRPSRPGAPPRRVVAWSFDHDTTEHGAAWQAMLRAVLTAIG